MSERIRAVPPDTVTVRLNEGPYAGLVATCISSASLGLMLEMKRNEETDWLEGLERRCRRFGGEILLSWNLDDKDGNPLPATTESMFSIPSELATELIMAWLNALTEPSDPLGPVSTNGSAAPLTTTDVQPASQRRSRRQS